MEKRHLLSSWILRLYDGVIRYFFLLVVAALLFMSAFSTCFIDKYEKTYFLPDTPWLKLAAAVLLFGLIVFCGTKLSLVKAFIERINTEEALFKKVRKGLLLTIWFALSLWVICTQVPSNADQRATLLAAKTIAEGDYSSNGQLGYLYIFNNQIGWTMVLYAFNKLFGEMNYVAYQLMNASIIVLVFKVLSELGRMMGMNNSKQLLVIAVSAAFVPLSLYASFIYGTIPGLWLSMLAIKYEIEYFNGGRTHQALFSALCIALAVMLKMNYLIFMVAMLIYAVVKAFCTDRLKKLLMVIFIAAFYFGQASLPIIVLENISGKPVPEGCSTLSWIAMGLQDGERPGWYNSYNGITFSESGYDVEKQKIWVKSDIKLRISELLNDLDYAREFFVKKTASQWNEPTFQSVWISMNHYQDAFGHGIMTVDNSWPEFILNPRGNHVVTLYMNFVSFMMLIGSFLYIMLCSRDSCFHEGLIFAMIFVGGFLFHLVWEVKGQYAMPYYVLLLPYTVMGYSKAAECLVALPVALRNGCIHIEKKALIGNAALLLLALAILCYVFHGTLPGITGDTEAYYAYLASHS